MADLLQFPSPAATIAGTSDAPAREAALDIRTSAIVEAPAGSGKTGLLVQRYLKLLGDASELGLSQPEEALAMTFTRKATAEMRDRVLKELEAANEERPLKDPGSAFERETRTLALEALRRSDELGWRILEQPQRLNIRSILSVCMDLTNALPLLAGNGSQLTPVEDAVPLYRLAARRTLMQLGGRDRALDRALRLVLLHRDGNLAHCEALLAEMLASRDQWGELVPLSPGALEDAELDRIVLPRLEHALEAIVCRGLSRALSAIPTSALHELTLLAQRLSREPGYNGAESPIALCADKHLPPAAIAEHLDHWRALLHLLLTGDGEWRKSFNKNHVYLELPKADRALLKHFIAKVKSEPLREALQAVRQLPPARYPKEQWAVARALFHVLRHALVELRLVFSERAECDFNELLLGARAALADNSTEDERTTDLALSAGGRLRHLLVDEMQDTSSAQYDLIRALTASWDGRSQTVFLVGDPKQSIYLFRQARVERFLRTVRERRLGDVDLQPLQLTANFRSQAALVEDFNAAFGGAGHTPGIFPSGKDLLSSGSQTAKMQDVLDVPFVRAYATREETTATGAVWHPSLIESVGLAYREQEALAIRSQIERCLARKLPDGRTRPWSVAVLGRTRGHLTEIVRALKGTADRPAIPFRGVDLDALAEAREVLDALALTRALLHPSDRIAWLSVLRAPWCGLSRADLLMLTGEGQTADPDATIVELVTERATLLSDEGQRLLARAWPVLMAATSTLGRTPLSVHVERTWRSLGGDAPLSSADRTNVERYLEVLHEAEGETGLIDLGHLKTRLRTLFAEPTSTNAQVELLTIHRAKGLEWDFVLLPGLERSPRGTTDTLLNWIEIDGLTPEEDSSILLAPISGKGQASSDLHQWLRKIRGGRERAETKRLFYVAATRAREELHLFAALKLKDSGELALPLPSTLLHAAWPAAQPHFAERLNALDMAESGGSDESSSPNAAALTWPGGGNTDMEEEESLAIAAGAENSSESNEPVRSEADSTPPVLERLPLRFDPQARFRVRPTERLDYPSAAMLRHAPSFDRPEGSFAARAFGNVVHRYLQLLSTRIAAGVSGGSLADELSAWQPRLETSLRGEGIAPALASREAARALHALRTTVQDPAGQWVLAAHNGASTERALQLPLGSLRADRTFFASEAPLSTGDGCLWIIDFKTTEPGSRDPERFRAAEVARYSPQLEAYADLLRSLHGRAIPIRLGLYFPLIPQLLHWPSIATE